MLIPAPLPAAPAIVTVETTDPRSYDSGRSREFLSGLVPMGGEALKLAVSSPARDMRDRPALNR
jgi:uncharacterized heparinase superfamily protein